MKKLTAIILAAILALCLIGGAAAQDKPYEGVTLNVLGNSSSPSTHMQERLAQFTEETGIKVNYEQLSNDQLNTKILVSMAAGGKDLDVFMFMAYQNTKMYVQNGWLEPLDQYLTEEFAIDDFLAGGRQASTVDGVLYGIPHGSEYGVLFYNKTMINDAGVDLAGIKTWEDLVAACATVEEKLPGTHGIAIRGSGHGSAAVVMPLVRAYGGDHFDAEGNAAFNSPEFAKGIGIYADLLKYGQEGASAMSWSETCNVFAQRQTAFRYDSDSQYTYLIDPDSSLVKPEELGFMAVPAGDVCANTYLGNWSIGMSYGSENKGAAWEFIRWMNNKEACIDSTVSFGSPIARQSTIDNAEVQAKYPDGYLDCIADSAAIAAGGPLPNMIYSTEARTYMGEAFDEIYAGGDLQENLDILNENIQELIDQEREEAQ
ncbi:MAG: sugar ABC transporter substrate-binding protein [Clostridia bacterium]|nr:sugar ABC transporter substrate-binding protein [Clostridia bacterium]